MGLPVSTAVQWWDEQQLRILVLSSLVVQYFLCFFAGMRKSRIPPWCRFFIWLSYLGSDALAIYALATLFNRQKKLQYRNRDLQVLWAPVLLMHLGGQMVITAYNIEDNELWRRHFVTALSQVTVAIYVFCRSWPSSADKRLLAAAVCLFVPGVARCFQKPLSLMRSSFNCLDSFFDASHCTASNEGQEELEAFVQEAKAAMLKVYPQDITRKIPFYLPHTLLLDSAYSYSIRLHTLKQFCTFDNKKAHQALKAALSNIFNLLYTKDGTTKVRDFINGIAYCILIPPILLPIAPIVLFHKSHKEAYNRSDINITFVLLYGTLLLEFISIFGLAASAGKWSDMVAQHNLVGCFVRNKRHSKLMSFIRCLSLEDFVNQYFGMKSCNSSKDITKLVRRHIQDGWRDYITDAQSYKEFNDIRGQWTLDRKGCDGDLGWSLERPFDKSVLLWHLATDFCFYHTNTSPDHDECANRCREISNYMMHLLCANPEMLLPGSRKLLFKVASDQLNNIFKGHEIPVDKKKLAQKMLDLESSQGSEGCFIRDARVIAKRLMQLSDENKMWEVIQGVWVEMLVFSAGRCRGYLHAKSIGTGGEYLSHIWILLESTGMETFQHKLQRTQKLRLSKEKRTHLESHGEDTAAPSTSQAMNLSKEERNTAGPSASQGEGTAPDELNAIVVSSQ